MTGPGRPLRFLLMIAAGWTALRIFLLWPQIDSVPALIRAIVPVAAAQTPAPPGPPERSASRPAVRLAALLPEWRAALARSVSAPPPRVADPRRVAMALLGFVSFGDPAPADDPGIVPGLPKPRPRTAGSRFSGSTWLVARGGGGLGAGVVGGQLGGSQAGIRLAYLLDVKHRIAAAARVTTPLGPGLRELAIGIEWQPTRLPVRIVAEQRIALNRGHGGPAIGIVGGAGPVAIGGGFRLDGYGQAGVIHRDETEAFVDGAAHVAHPLGALGTVRFDLGAGLWGAAQRGAARLDLGPSLGAVVPIGKQNVRLSLDWRERVAGDARPGSGIALTLGADF